MNKIEDKTDKGIALSKQELIDLYNNAELSELAAMADKIRRKLNQNKVFYNRNFHLEPSNVCKHRCEFCSFRRESIFDEGAWDMSLDEARQYCKEKYEKGMTEVHIVGSVHPEKELDYYINLVKIAREELPKEVIIKGFTAIEILGMKGEYSVEETLKKLKDAGLETLPGGGAEILVDSIREKICPDKAMSEEWLDVHRIAHKLGMPTNATMMYGHIDTREDRIEHLLKIRALQEEYHGFNAFIPLKYLPANNLAAAKYNIQELDNLEVLRTFAISRIALNNISHIKAYWPMLGKELTEMALHFGADDIDGTINNSTKIYSMAGAQDQKPQMSIKDLENLCFNAGYIATERNSLYK